MADSPPGNCDVCKRTTHAKCSACKNLFYCCKEHQRKGWKKHAKYCKPFKLLDDPIVGRHYVATKDLKVGDVIIKERPLYKGFILPTVIVCLGCSKQLEKDSAVPCALCSWPLCATCTDHGQECGFISSRTITKELIAEHSFMIETYQCIDTIRILSMNKGNPKIYKKLMSYQSHSDKDTIKKVASNIEEMVRKLFQCDDLTSEDFAKVAGVLRINGFGTPKKVRPQFVIYELASFIEHNCKANCSRRITSDGRLLIRVETPIAKGDHITVSYSPPLLGNEQRKHFLMRYYFFECTCERCKDPTEFGVMLNSLKCRKSECTGYNLPETFIGSDPNPYICKVCKSSISYEEVNELLTNIGIDATKIKENGNAECSDFLTRYKDVLHPNHFYNLDIIMFWVNKTSLEDLGHTNRVILGEWIKSCKKLNILLRIIAPADVDLRGSLLKFICTTLTMTHLKKNFAEAKNCLDEAHELLKYD